MVLSFRCRRCRGKIVVGNAHDAHDRYGGIIAPAKNSCFETIWRFPDDLLKVL